MNYQRNRNRTGDLLAWAITALLIALLAAALIYDQAHAAELQVQLLVNGQPAANVDYTLEGLPNGDGLPNGMITGATDSDGMIVAKGIATGTWRLTAPCVLAIVEVGEVSGQAVQEVDAACVVWMPTITN